MSRHNADWASFEWRAMGLPLDAATLPPPDLDDEIEPLLWGIVDPAIAGKMRRQKITHPKRGKRDARQ